jgi:hypothetical protein
MANFVLVHGAWVGDGAGETAHRRHGKQATRSVHADPDGLGRAHPSHEPKYKLRQPCHRHRQCDQTQAWKKIN